LIGATLSASPPEESQCPLDIIRMMRARFSNLLGVDLGQRQRNTAHDEGLDATEAVVVRWDFEAVRRLQQRATLRRQRHLRLRPAAGAVSLA
jgi:hypothetical protein